MQESTKESIMTEYRFHLQKYRPGSKTVCPECGRKACFTRYIDKAGEISFPDSVGMCDHINSCGYHYTPKEYFRDNPAVKERLNGQERFGGTPIAARPPARALPEQKPRISFLPYDWVEQSMRGYDINPLYRYFTKVAGKEEAGRLFHVYKVGTSRMWNGSTVFWQIDVRGNVRAGKIMGYDAVTGHRIKEPFSQVNWVHSVRKVPDFHMKQCLFGEHLLSDTSVTMSTKPVAIVESEKTALVAALPGLHLACHRRDARVLQQRDHAGIGRPGGCPLPRPQGDGRMEATAADDGILLQACHMLRHAGEDRDRCTA